MFINYLFTGKQSLVSLFAFSQSFTAFLLTLSKSIATEDVFMVPF